MDQHLETALIVDDDPNICDSLKMVLGSEYRTVLAYTGPEALEAARSEPPKAVLLDLLIPEIDGIQVCRELRQNPKTMNSAILIVSGVKSKEKYIQAFEAGADDWIEKPVEPFELLNRIRAQVVNRWGTKILKITHLGNLLLDEARQRVSINSEIIDLNQTEFGIVRVLVKNPRRTVTHAEIFAAASPENGISRRTLENRIIMLRQKLARFNHRIVSVYGVGYELKPISW